MAPTVYRAWQFFAPRVCHLEPAAANATTLIDRPTALFGCFRSRQPRPALFRRTSPCGIRTPDCLGPNHGLQSQWPQAKPSPPFSKRAQPRGHGNRTRAPWLQSQWPQAKPSPSFSKRAQPRSPGNRTRDATRRRTPLPASEAARANAHAAAKPAHHLPARIVLFGRGASP